MVIRQLLSFGAVGATQLLLDWAVFVTVSALGMAALPANVLGRICGAGAGFCLNGAVTFRRSGRAVLGARQLYRFALMWCGFTLVSSAAVWCANALGGLQLAWAAKPIIEAALALASFGIARQWVYR